MKSIKELNLLLQLLKALRNTSVNVNGTHIEFDSSGNPNIGYSVLEWIWNGSDIGFKDVGSFLGQLTINKSQITWHTGKSEVITAIYQNMCNFPIKFQL